MNALELRPVSGRIGTEVINPDLEVLLADDDVRAELHRALLDHHLVVLRNLDPTPEEHVQLAAAIGAPIAPEDLLP